MVPATRTEELPMELEPLPTHVQATGRISSLRRAVHSHVVASTAKPLAVLLAVVLTIRRDMDIGRSLRAGSIVFALMIHFPFSPRFTFAAGILAIVFARVLGVICACILQVVVFAAILAAVVAARFAVALTRALAFSGQSASAAFFSPCTKPLSYCSCSISDARRVPIGAELQLFAVVASARRSVEAS